MDRSRYRRPGIQTQSQTTTKTIFGNSQPVPRTGFVRPMGNMHRQAYKGSIALGNYPFNSEIKSTNIMNTKLPKTYLKEPTPIINGVRPVPKGIGQPSQTALLARRQPIDMSLPGAES